MDEYALYTEIGAVGLDRAGDLVGSDSGAPSEVFGKVAHGFLTETIAGPR